VATKHHCDRCNRQVETAIYLQKITYPSQRIDNLTEVRELCGYCVKGLLDFLKPLPRNTAKSEEVTHAS
jgi:hypothetical protein